MSSVGRSLKYFCTDMPYSGELYADMRALWKLVRGFSPGT